MGVAHTVGLTVFFTSLGLLMTTYVVYPLIMRALAFCLPYRRSASATYADGQWPRVAVIIAAHNAADTITERLQNLLSQDYPGQMPSIYVGSDGSTDATVELLAQLALTHPNLYIRPFARVGKNAVVEVLIAEACSGHDILAFTDSRVLWAPGTLQALVAPFAYHNVGTVGGSLAVPNPKRKWFAWLEKAYRRIEVNLRHAEARVLGAFPGAFGPCYAVHSACLPPNLSISGVDDMVVSMLAMGKNFRGVMALNAVAFHAPGANEQAELRRKRRIALRSWLAIARLRRLFYCRGLGFGLAFFTHKVLRNLGPVWLLGMLAGAGLATTSSIMWGGFFVGGGSMALLGLLQHRVAPRRLPLGLHLVAYPLATQLAQFLGLWDFVVGKEGQVWAATPRVLEAPAGS